MEKFKKSPKPYKVCFLGYPTLCNTAKDVIAQLPESDIEYILMECDLINLDECVKEALQLGCSVFIGGLGNAALFSTKYTYPLVEIPVRYIDYVRAIRSVLKQNCRKIYIARHRYSASVDLPMLEDLMETPLHEFTFESPAEFYEFASHTDFDALIGTTMAVDAARAMGRVGALLYSGKESIRDACIRAGELAQELYETRRSKEIANAILNNTQFGIIVTDSNDRVLLFNQTAQRFTGVAPATIRGQLLANVFPNLSTSALLKSNQRQIDSYRLVEGAMMRCVQEKIEVNRQTLGVLLTLYPDSHNRKKKESPLSGSFSHSTYHWEDLISESPAMKNLINLGRNIAKFNYPTALLGAPGSGRETIAYCMHASSSRAKCPCITIDLATFSEDDIPHILMGYEKNDRSISGLLASANGGSVVIKNISATKPAALACLMQVLTSHQIFRPGMEAPLLLDIVFYTVMTQKEFQNLPADIRSCLSICLLDVPPLSQRAEDIGPLFLKFLAHNTAFNHRPMLTEQMQSLLSFHGWPGELRELQAVCMRYALAMGEQEKPSHKTRSLMLLRAIGEDVIYNEVLEKYPELLQHPIEDKASFRKGVLLLKSLTNYSNDILAEKLAVSRTTIWRILQDTSSAE